MHVREEAARALAEAGRALHGAGLVAGTAGNLSVRLADGRILATPTGHATGRLDPTDMVEVAASPSGGGTGAPHAGGATSELPLHRACYEARSDVGAVVHAHPPALLAVSLRGLAVEERLPEVGLATGPIASVPFVPSGSLALAEAVGDAVAGGAGVVVLERHGAVAVAGDIDTALHRMELAELAAYTVLLAEDGGSGVDGARLDALLERLRDRR